MPVPTARAPVPPKGRGRPVPAVDGAAAAVGETETVSSDVLTHGGPEMLHFQQLAETHSYRFPAEQAERERTARRAELAALARNAKAEGVPRAAPRRSLVPRIAGALGLF